MPWDKQFDADQVLGKAMEAFWERGYEATSMQELVERTGVNRGSLYATFGDKHQLFLAALRMYDSEHRRKRLAEFETSFTPREAIRQLFLAFASQASAKGKNRGCFMTNTALELAAHDPEVKKIVTHAQREVERFFSRMIGRGQELGEIGPSVHPERAASGLLASLLGLIVLTRSRPESSLLLAIVDDAMHRLG